MWNFIEQRKDKIVTGNDFTLDHPYWIRVDLGGDYHTHTERYTAIKTWADHTFGAHSPGWNNPRWQFDRQKYYFKNEKDRIMFYLRWS